MVLWCLGLPARCLPALPWPYVRINATLASRANEPTDPQLAPLNVYVCVCACAVHKGPTLLCSICLDVYVCVCKRFAFVSVCYAVCRVLAVCIRWVWPQWPLACYRTRRCLEYYIHLYSVRCDGPAMARARFLEAVSRPNSPRSTNVINETPDGN